VKGELVRESLEYRCRDERIVGGSGVRCFETLMDLSTYSRWWTLVTVTPEGPGSRLRPGARFRFVGARPGGERFEWAADVLEIEEPSRIELSYGVESTWGGQLGSCKRSETGPSSPTCIAAYERIHNGVANTLRDGERGTIQSQ